MKNLTTIAFVFTMIAILPACFGGKKKVSPSKPESLQSEEKAIKKVIGDKEDYSF